MDSNQVDSRQSSVNPESSPATAPGKFIPYTTTKHHPVKSRYITSTDPRGYVPVHEYSLNNQWIMMDVDDGYILWTGIWKALGNSKADIVKMVEAQPELASKLRRVRGGYLKIQGTWLPYEVALRLARRVAWPIRYDLIPFFGPNFPDTCLAPDAPGYGQVVVNPNRKNKRSKYVVNADSGNNAIPNAYPPNDVDPNNGDPARSQYHYSSRQGDPSYDPNAQYDYPPSHRPNAQFAPYSYSQQQQYYSNLPAPVSPPGPYPGNHSRQSAFQQPRDAYALSEDTSSVNGGASRLTSPSLSNASRHRYAPYPQSSPGSSNTRQQDPYSPPSPNSQSSSRSHGSYSHSYTTSASTAVPQYSSRNSRYDLPPIHSLDVPHQDRPNPSQQPLPSFSLPPITSLREGSDRPEQDPSAVLRRLRLDDRERERENYTTREREPTSFVRGGPPATGYNYNSDPRRGSADPASGYPSDHRWARHQQEQELYTGQSIPAVVGGSTQSGTRRASQQNYQW